jgi:myo-inositol-1(or 4)-monophosphatase
LPVAELHVERAAVGARLAGAVREAGALALQKFRSPLKSWMKAANSPVSEVDIAVDQMLRERLMMIAPTCGWLSEESVDDPARLQARQVWIVDPIDGTRAFLGGRRDWVIAAALVADRRPVLAAIFAPVDDTMFLAAAGEGTTVNGTRVTASSAETLERARTAGPKRYLDALAAVRPGIEPMAKVHSLALRLAKVADGSLDVAFAGANSHDWDLAAADLIVHEAGGMLTTLDGRQLTYNCPNPVHAALVAAGRGRHEALMRSMQDRQGAFA